MHATLLRSSAGFFLRLDGAVFGPVGRHEALRLVRVSAARGVGLRAPVAPPDDAAAIEAADAPPSVTRYELHGSPESIPVDWTPLPEPRRARACALAGLEAADPGLPTGRLRERWNLHPAGSPVVATFVVQGHDLVVIDEPAGGRGPRKENTDAL